MCYLCPVQEYTFVIFCWIFEHFVTNYFIVWIVPVSYTHLDVYKRQSPNNYGTISRGDGEVWDVRGSAEVTSSNLCLFETGTKHLGSLLEDDGDDKKVENLILKHK